MATTPVPDVGDVQVRLLTADDAEAYRRIRLAALHDAPEAFGSTYAVEAARPLTHFADRLTHSAVFAVFAAFEATDEPVGMVGFARDDGPRERHKGFLWGMYVAPGYRRRGVARALLQAVLDHAAREVEQVRLTVVRENKAALSLWRAHGFASYGVEPRSLRSASGYADEVLMVRIFAPDDG